MKHTKTSLFALVLAVIMMLSLSACTSRNNVASSTFPSIDKSYVPDSLEKSVGTLGNVYFTTFGASDNTDYQSFLEATFENATKVDYTALMEHYQLTSTGTGDNGLLLFDWGQLKVSPDNGSITINAYIE